MCKERRLVALFDLHIPHQIELKPIYEFMKDFKPNIIVLGGDVFNADYWFKVNKADYHDFMSDDAVKIYKNEMDEVNNVLDELDKHCAEDCVKDYCEGNHEVRIDRILEKFPKHQSSIMANYDYKRDLKLHERGYRWHGYNQIIKHGRLYFTHGIYHQQNHSKAHLVSTGRNIRYGHTHDIQAFSMVSDIDHHERISKSCGCLCKINPQEPHLKYMRNRPNKFQNAFLQATINEDGTFYEHLVKIVHGKSFRTEGKTYS